MSALSFPSSVPLAAWQQIRRVGPLGAIIGLHIAFFYALQSGLLHQAAQALPKEVFASFITPDPAPQPEVPKPPPAAPKTVPVVKKAVTRPTPVAPAINPTPSQQAITTPPAAPQSDEPPAVAAPAAPQAPAAPAAPAQPKVISGIEYIQAPQPDYPPIAKRMSEEGTVIVHVLVNEKGRAEHADVKKSSGSPRLDEAGRKAALRALFKPYMEDGKAISVSANIPITFNLNN